MTPHTRPQTSQPQTARTAATSKTMTASSVRMGATVRRGAIGQYPRSVLETDLLTESLREFRRAALPFGNRLGLKGRGDMLSGKRTSPHGYVLQLLIAGRRARLPKTWALRMVAWTLLVINRLWADERVDVAALERAEQDAESLANARRLELYQEPTEERRIAWLNAELEEMAATMAMCAGHGCH